MESRRQHVSEHLDELRKRFIRCLFGATLGLLLCWMQAQRLLNVLLSPALARLRAQQSQLVVVDVMDRFWIELKLAAIGSFILCLPLFLREFYVFARPALRDSERRGLRTLFLSAPLLFLAGFALWLFLILPQALDFLLRMGPSGITNMLNLNQFLSFALSMGLLFGLLFQLPVMLLLLMRLGLLDVELLARKRRVVLLLLAVASAVLTPSPDAFSMVMLLLPLYLLFELTLVAGRVSRKRAPIATENA